MEQNAQQHQIELEQTRSFYVAIVEDLKQQVADLADQKAVQVAMNKQKQQLITMFQQSDKEKEEKIKDLEAKLLGEKAKNAGPVPKQGGEK